MNNINQYYEILNVDSSASLETVKAAYRGLAKIWHPDLCINNPKLKAQAEIEIKRINQAYTAIKSYLESNPDLSGKIDINNQPQVSIRKNRAYSSSRNKVKNNVNYKKTKQAQIIRCLISISALQKSIVSIVISSDDKTFASIGKDNKIKLWSINTGKKIAVLKGHSGIINSIIIDTRGRFLVSAGRDETLRLWNLKTHKTIKTFRGYLSNPGETTSLFLNSDNKTLLTFNTDSTIQVWDINRNEIVKTITWSGYFDRLDVAKNCKTFCTTHLTFPLQIRNIENGKVIRSINNDSDIICTAFSPDSSQLATGGFDRLIMLWDINTGNKIHTLTGHSGRVSSVAFSSDGKNIISGDWDGTIKVWQLKTGKEIMSIKAHFSKIKTISITYNNQTLITGDERGEIKIWRCFF